MAGTVRAGDDLDIFLPTVKDALGRLVSLAGATLHASVQLASGAKVSASNTWVDAATGTGRARWNRAATILWVANTDVTYDLRVVLADGTLGTVAEGSFIVKAPITPQPV